MQTLLFNSVFFCLQRNETLACMWLVLVIVTEWSKRHFIVPLCLHLHEYATWEYFDRQNIQEKSFRLENNSLIRSKSL